MHYKAPQKVNRMSGGKPHRAADLPADGAPQAVPVWWQALAVLFFATALCLTFQDTELGRTEERRAMFLKRLDLNTASRQQLEALPGIGPVLAKQIIRERPYANAEDLMRVRGVGPKLFEKLLPLIRTTDALPGKVFQR